jgi:hypothetical protein
MQQALARWVLVLGGLLASGCITVPDAPVDQADTSEEPPTDATAGTDVVASDTQVTADTAGGSDTKTDSKPGTDIAAPTGCKGNVDCSNLVTGVCEVAKCDLATGICGVTTLPDGETCGGPPDLCISARVCQSGVCQVTFVVCEDGNACTVDTCDPSVGCQSAPAPPGLCDDGDACTSGSTCVAGQCKPAASVNCDDKNPCTSDVCDKVSGCSSTPVADGGACDDGKVCTESDACKGGVCTGPIKSCPSDGNACTDDSCTEQNKGCLSVAIPLPLLCDDNNPCTSGDVCEGSLCKGVSQVCDDKNSCTSDSCVAGTGCVFAPLDTGACDATACQAAGTCSAGTCSGAAKNCDDGNLCTSDSCDPVTGCQHTPNTAPCFDGSVCSENDQCQQGVCVPGIPLACEDGNPCTDDGCEQYTGCIFEAKPTGSSCGSNLSCVVGVCLDNSCGDGLCSPSETTDSCAQDCPATGGECGPTDGQCLQTCRTSKCAAAETKCNGITSCMAVGGCIGQCAGEAACEVACLVQSDDAAVDAFLELNQCMQAFCFDDDYWLGKSCTALGPNYLTCVTACEAGMCKTLSALCGASDGCVAARDCIKGCGNADPGQQATCTEACKALGTLDDLFLNADLDDCSALYCQ